MYAQHTIVSSLAGAAEGAHQEVCELEELQPRGEGDQLLEAVDSLDHPLELLRERPAPSHMVRK
jgi:hypothetical protein